MTNLVLVYIDSHHKPIAACRREYVVAFAFEHYITRSTCYFAKEHMTCQPNAELHYTVYISDGDFANGVWFTNIHGECALFLGRYRNMGGAK